MATGNQVSRPFAFAWLVLALCANCASAQWTATSLHPPGTRGSYITSGADGALGGVTVLNSGLYRPAFWPGLSAAWTDLAGSSATAEGFVQAMWGGQQGGSYTGGAIWSGTPESRIDMGGQQILGMGPGQQAGFTSLQVSGQTREHALVWNGTPGSMIDLNPAGFLDSSAFATDGQHQGGRVVNPANGGYLATMWTGSASSYMNMNPSWALTSEIRGMGPGQQVGRTQHIGSSADHATIWSGTAESALDIHPFPGYGGSWLAATVGFAQVGTSSVPGFTFDHAGLWFGTAASFVDLHQFLPTGYFQSHATCIQEWNGQLLIGGWASRTGQPEAWVWVGVPSPATALPPLGFLAFAIARRRR